jgi:hypothetical protein
MKCPDGLPEHLKPYWKEFCPKSHESVCGFWLDGISCDCFVILPHLFGYPPCMDWMAVAKYWGWEKI